MIRHSKDVDGWNREHAVASRSADPSSCDVIDGAKAVRLTSDRNVDGDYGRVRKLIDELLETASVDPIYGAVLIQCNADPSSFAAIDTKNEHVNPLFADILSLLDELL